MGQIVEPSIEFIHGHNLLRKLRLAYAVCYKNEDSIKWENAEQWICSKANIGHRSPLEHVRIKVPLEEYNELLSQRRKLGANNVPYGFNSRINVHMRANKKNVEMNVRDWLEIGGNISKLGQYEEATDYATVKIICDRGVSHELVRHRSLCFTQESTRYCNYDGKMTFINLYSAFKADGIKGWMKKVLFRGACSFAETIYSALIHLGASPQEARAVLPNCLKTEIWITGTFGFWKSFLRLRNAPSAHPQARQIAQMIQSSIDCPNKMRF